MTESKIKIPTKPELIAQIVELGRLNISADAAAAQTLTELGLDSLGFVELAMGLEDALQTTLDLDNLSPDTQLSVLVDQILADLTGGNGNPESTGAASNDDPDKPIVVPVQAAAMAKPVWVRGVSFEVDLPNYSLRALKPSDVNDEYVSWWNDAEIQSRLGAPARGWGLAQARQHVGRFDTLNNLHLGIFDRSNARLIGFYTIFSQPKTGVASTNRVIGNRDYWRRGISRELSAWSIPFIFDTLGMAKISASIHGENKTSMWLVE